LFNLSLPNSNQLNISSICIEEIIQKVEKVGQKYTFTQSANHNLYMLSLFFNFLTFMELNALYSEISSVRWSYLSRQGVTRSLD